MVVLEVVLRVVMMAAYLDFSMAAWWDGREAVGKVDGKAGVLEFQMVDMLGPCLVSSLAAKMDSFLAENLAVE